MSSSPLPRLLLGVGCAGVALAAAFEPSPAVEEPIDFARDVRPVLARTCFTCHGPDAAARKADLRLDVRDEAFADRGGYHALVAGDLEASEAWLRIADESDPMPPVDSGVELSDEERATLRRWIEEGAKWQEHWSYVPPVRPEVPDGPAGHEVRNPIDAFLGAALAREGLEPTPTADRATLLRRVTLDLTGLPPTPEELDAFQADTAPGAWDRVLERLFSSPRYGEAMARDWLDAARFGDTHGYHLDNERSLWPWRDWVIEAYNQNKPFDEFTIEQLAGDLLPDPTIAQRVATGFNRCNVTTGEGGLIEAEYLVKYAVDRVDTTATVWLGATLACASCHDHKYDPYSQEDFYRFFAFFNSIAEEGTDRNALAPPPNLRVPSAEQTLELERQRAAIAEAAVRLDAPDGELDAAQQAWEETTAARVRDRWRALEPIGATTLEGDTRYVWEEAGVLATSPVGPGVVDVIGRTDLEGVTGVRIEALAWSDDGTDRTPVTTALSHVSLRVTPMSAPHEVRPVLWTGGLALDPADAANLESLLDPDAAGWSVAPDGTGRGWVLYPEAPFGADGDTWVNLRLTSEGDDPAPLPQRLRISLTNDPAVGPTVASDWWVSAVYPADSRETVFDAGRHLLPFDPEAVDEAGAPAWRPAPEYVDATTHLFQSSVASVWLARTIDSPGARTLDLALGSDDGIRVWLNDRLVHDNPAARGVALDQDRVTVDLVEGRNVLVMQIANFGGAHGFAYRVADESFDGAPANIVALLLGDAGQRTDAQRLELQRHYRETQSPAWRERRAALDGMRADEAALVAALPITMVMQERAQPRPAHLLIRGQYDQPGDPVTRGVPGHLPPLEAEAPTRLDLARWIVSPENPLTARVTVNRMWQRFFGRGIVTSVEDFGSRGALPSHPELLDWLAVEFVASGWDVQHMQRLMLDSAAYRRSAAAPAAARDRDPENTWLSRGPRFRLDAEMLRDQALFASGLLVETVGGPSVRPYQPDGVWFAVGYTGSNTVRFVQDMGDALWRRSLYTFWKRTAPPPSMAAFDAPSREACTVSRARTNTPMQALTLMNDVQYVEAARALGARVLRERDDDDARLERAFRLVVSRAPTARELDVLRELLVAERDGFGQDLEGARGLIEVGEAPTPDDLDPAELAAWTVVASTLLNLDEAITRG